eukprot:CAMPEP_0198205994 /NCGR_PEP_ID=MMETSP1445-20131203/9523_1 /TAXON_ID=36898 /ORGANISM="Pyramimonas sp., Strain CCMP2087" /LENGTH=272 /DNA_ID=CAMNT_0043878511 /DNA_START=315 /DNA_END=1134 /DNA_ORIENTATION=+
MTNDEEISEFFYPIRPNKISDYPNPTRPQRSPDLNTRPRHLRSQRSPDVRLLIVRLVPLRQLLRLFLEVGEGRAEVSGTHPEGFRAARALIPPRYLGWRDGLGVEPVVVLVLREVPEADLAVVPAQVQEHAAAETDAHHCERHQRAEHYRDRLALGRIGGVTFLVALWMISLYGEGGGCVLFAPICVLYGGDLLGGGSVDADVSICVKEALVPPPPSPLLREALLVGAEVADASRADVITTKSSPQPPHPQACASYGSPHPVVGNDGNALSL